MTGKNEGTDDWLNAATAPLTVPAPEVSALGSSGVPAVPGLEGGNPLLGALLAAQGVEHPVQGTSLIGKEQRDRPTRSPNAFEDTLQRLLQMIHLGVVSPGEQLPPERDFARRLGVSRDTLRDALGTLSESGYLVSRRGRGGGTFVAEQLPPELRAPSDSAPALSTDDIADALGTRFILETGAARIAATRSLSASERAQLWHILTESQRAGPEDYRRLDSRFHLFIAELAAVPSIITPLARARTLANNLLDGLPLIAPNIRHSNEQHEAIALAILSGNQELAYRAMCEHLEGTAALIHGFYGK
ncbi:GntR family transcriptional regulator [Lysinibacter sp. HNR]|uniref:FadR/GntR family transcriptional regulator n=1 Tax=Lysinibacter sp. HNR TaxID=3031408 RepID=UPI002435DAB5|nr:GntR family transcriptional regulator [Lysinibacter sp. HNR]WGD37200.1 GntR family transcriptional regulator [Lysinibacter sp. HNR]